MLIPIMAISGLLLAMFLCGKSCEGGWVAGVNLKSELGTWNPAKLRSLFDGGELRGDQSHGWSRWLCRW